MFLDQWIYIWVDNVLRNCSIEDATFHFAGSFLDNNFLFETSNSHPWISQTSIALCEVWKEKLISSEPKLPITMSWEELNWMLIKREKEENFTIMQFNYETHNGDNNLTMPGIFYIENSWSKRSKSFNWLFHEIEIMLLLFNNLLDKFLPHFF